MVVSSANGGALEVCECTRFGAAAQLRRGLRLSQGARETALENKRMARQGVDLRRARGNAPAFRTLGDLSAKRRDLMVRWAEFVDS